MGMTEVLGAFGGVAGGAGVITGVYYTYKAKSKEVESSNEQKMIDQLQEAQKSYESRLEALEAKYDKLIIKETVARTFIWKLINHINTRQDPPAPDWPEGLL